MSRDQTEKTKGIKIERKARDNDSDFEEADKKTALDFIKRHPDSIADNLSESTDIEDVDRILTQLEMAGKITKLDPDVEFPQYRLNITREEWNKIIANNKSISNDQRLYLKFFNKINKPSGFAFSDLHHLKDIEKRLDEKLEKLAKKHGYVTEGFTQYQSWIDHSPKEVIA